MDGEHSFILNVFNAINSELIYNLDLMIIFNFIHLYNSLNCLGTLRIYQQ